MQFNSNQFIKAPIEACARCTSTAITDLQQNFDISSSITKPRIGEKEKTATIYYCFSEATKIFYAKTVQLKLHIIEEQ